MPGAHASGIFKEPEKTVKHTPSAKKSIDYYSVFITFVCLRL